MDEFEFKFERVKLEMEQLQKNMIAYGKSQFMIKGWAITLFSALLFFGSNEINLIFLLFGAVVVVLFWTLDSFFKHIQLVYIKRALEVERLLQHVQFSTDGRSFDKHKVPMIETYFKALDRNIPEKAKQVFCAALKFQIMLFYAAMLAILAGLYAFEECGLLYAAASIIIIFLFPLIISGLSHTYCCNVPELDKYLVDSVPKHPNQKLRRK
ncbi:MAG: hypothetical protein JSW28_08600 [Thermoplasmata archaeon]|nr:MAG: hypothetical protein JSW28_08600 [Thermoplasmata archaeon]